MEQSYAFGRISSFTSNGIAAKVLVLGSYVPQGKKFTNFFNLLPDKVGFPDNGEVFAPNLKNDLPHVNEGDYICFCYEQNLQYQPGKSKYIIPSGKFVELCGRSGLFLLPKEYSDDELRSQPHIALSGNNLYFRRRKNGKTYILGPLKNNNGSLVPQIGTGISASEEMAGDILFRDPEKGISILRDRFENSRTKVFTIDCMTDEQLLDWFKKKTKNYDLGTLKIIEGIINHQDASDDQLTVSRWERIKKKLGDSVYIREHLPELKKLEPFQEAIRQQLDEFAAEEKERITDEIRAQAEEDLEKEMNERKAALEKEFEELEKKNGDLKSKKQKLEAACSEAAAAIQSQEQTLKVLQEKKEELVEDVKLKAGLGLLGGPVSSQWCYPLEEITPCPNAKAVSIGDWENMLYNCLDIHNDEENNGVAKLGTKKFVQVEDIKSGIRLAKAFGNTIYELCQPSPKWISFHEFWSESLKPIWESAHCNPAVWHFLLIENFNLALPECWGKPLWNLLEKKTRLLPCAKNPEYPGNLRIIVSVAQTDSDDNTHLGLPTQVTPDDTITIPDFRLNDDEVEDFLADHYCGMSNE